MTTDDIMALVESYRTAGGREEHWVKQDHLCNAIAAIKEERDALQASLREAKKLLEAYAQVKADDEARMRQALDTLAYWLEHGETPGSHDMIQRTHDALQERLGETK